jgi:hypothetical protein
MAFTCWWVIQTTSRDGYVICTENTRLCHLYWNDENTRIYNLYWKYKDMSSVLKCCKYKARRYFRIFPKSLICLTECCITGEQDERAQDTNIMSGTAYFLRRSRCVERYSAYARVDFTRDSHTVWRNACPISPFSSTNYIQTVLDRTWHFKVRVRQESGAELRGWD